MHKDLKQIPARIREMREILDISADEMAERLKISPGEYAGYENGEIDISISALYSIAAIFGVDFTVLLTGEGPKMEDQCVVRAGDGVIVDRFDGYSYSSLAYKFIGRIMEPLLVKISPLDEPIALVIHSGQEFNYVLSGKIRITVGRRVYELAEGDSIYFNPRLPHGQEAVGGDAAFLTVINE